MEYRIHETNKENQRNGNKKNIRHHQQLYETPCIFVQFSSLITVHFPNYAFSAVVRIRE